MRPQRLLAYACLALSMSLVGSYVALSKTLVAAIPVLLLAWLRFGIGAAAMLHWLRKPPHEPPLTRRTRQLLFLESFLGNFLFSLFMLYGVSLTSAVAAGVIMASIPAVVALLSWAFLRERIAPRTWAAVACAAGGHRAAGAGPSRRGAGRRRMAVARQPAGVRRGGVRGLVRRHRQEAHRQPRRRSASPRIINLWGLALVTPLGLWAALDFDFARVAPGIWLLLLFYALAASVWTVWLWMTGLKGVPAAQAGVFTVMLPVSAAVVGVFVLGEPLGGAQLLAFVLALAGVLLATLPARRDD